MASKTVELATYLFCLRILPRRSSSVSSEIICRGILFGLFMTMLNRRRYSPTLGNCALSFDSSLGSYYATSWEKRLPKYSGCIWTMSSPKESSSRWRSESEKSLNSRFLYSLLKLSSIFSSCEQLA